MTGGRSGAGAGTDADNGLRAALEPLRDIDGIVGSFVAARGGRVVACDLPPLFDTSVLAEASHRLLRLEETFAAAGDRLDAAVIRFSEQKLYLKILEGGMLCIVTDGAVNTPALRMAASLVARRIGSALDGAGTAAAHVEAAVPGRPAGASGWLYRGHRVG